MFDWLGRIFDHDTGTWDVAELAGRLDLPESQLREIEPRYHRFTIPKRSGGTRTILAPDPRLKALQRRILYRLLARLRAHPAACGFEVGCSIVDNALPHVARKVVIRLDIRDFFGSTTARRVERYFRAIGWQKEPAALLTRLCTHEGALPQGAPTSPRLANLINYKLDARLDGMAAAMGASYTRYADDLTFSSDEPLDLRGAMNPRTLERSLGRRRLNEIIPRVKQLLSEYGYVLHEGPKLRIMRRHHRQKVTGLVVNEQIALPRKTRRWLRSVEHHVATGRPATITPEQLEGWIGLREMVERQTRGL